MIDKLVDEYLKGVVTLQTTSIECCANSVRYWKLDLPLSNIRSEISEASRTVWKDWPKTVIARYAKYR
jgi:hypothetical protein